MGMKAQGTSQISMVLNRSHGFCQRVDPGIERTGGTTANRPKRFSRCLHVAEKNTSVLVELQTKTTFKQEYIQNRGPKQRLDCSEAKACLLIPKWESHHHS